MFDSSVFIDLAKFMNSMQCVICLFADYSLVLLWKQLFCFQQYALEEQQWLMFIVEVIWQNKQILNVALKKRVGALYHNKSYNLVRK